MLTLPRAEACPHYVAQLGLTIFHAAHVAFRPGVEHTLMVVNRFGRIDLFDLLQPERPLKIGEIHARARCAAFSPRGSGLVSGDANGAIQLWTLDGRPAGEPFQPQVGSVASVAFSACGARIASAADDGLIRLWTLDGKQAAEPIAAEVGGPVRLAFQPAGTRLASGGPGGLRLWTLAGQPIDAPRAGQPTEKVRAASVGGLAWSQDGQRLVTSGADGALRVWTQDGLPAAEPIPIFPGPASWMARDGWSVAFNPRGDRILSPDRHGAMRLWTVKGRPDTEAFARHRMRNGAGETFIRGAIFSPSGERIVSWDSDGVVRFWALHAEPASVHRPADEEKAWTGRKVWCLAFSPDGERMVTAHADGCLQLRTGEGRPLGQPISAHQATPKVAFRPDGELFASGGSDGAIHLWSRDGRSVAHFDSKHPEGPAGLAFTPSGDRLVSVGRDGAIRLWTCDGRLAVEVLRAHGQRWGGVAQLRCIATSPAGDRFATGDLHGTARLWTLEGKRAAKSFRGHRDSIESIAFHPRGDRLATGSHDRTVRLWTLEGALAATPIHLNAVVEGVAFNPEGDRLVVGCCFQGVRFFTLEGKAVAEPIAVLDGNGDGSPFALHPDGLTIAVGGNDGAVRSWKLRGRTVGELSSNDRGWTLDAVVGPDVRFVASTVDSRSIRCWRLHPEPPPDPIEWSTHEEEQLADRLATDARGRRILAGGDGCVGRAFGLLQRWTLAGRRLGRPCKFSEAIGSVYDLAFNPKGDLWVSAVESGWIRLWSARREFAAAGPMEWACDACAVAFSADGRHVISGGGDGKIQFWSLDGAPVGTALCGHDAPVDSLAMGSGGVLVSASRDGTVRAWDPATGEHRIVDRAMPGEIRRRVQALEHGGFALCCEDRIRVLGPAFDLRGELFLHAEGVVIVTSEGVYAPTDELQSLVRAIGEDGRVQRRRGAVAALSLRQARKILLAR